MVFSLFENANVEDTASLVDFYWTTTIYATTTTTTPNSKKGLEINGLIEVR